VDTCTVIPVNRDHLRLAFNKLGVPESSYSFSGPGQGECYVIEPDDDGWITYYAERGKRRSLTAFTSEDTACKFMLGWFCGALDLAVGSATQRTDLPAPDRRLLVALTPD